MKTLFQSLNKSFTLIAGIGLLISCNLDDEPPNNELGKYDLPLEVASEIFTSEVLAVTGSLEPFLDLIQQNGMKIYEGDTPPEMYNFFSQSADYQIFDMDHSCLFDNNYPAYKDSIFGRYKDQLMILRNQEDNFESYLRYYSLTDKLFPQYTDSLDYGNGIGITSGNGFDFTIFVNIKNGKFRNSNYEALWIISGTYRIVDGESPSEYLKNVTKCMVILEKSGDTNNELANIGTIRIYKDDSPFMYYRD